MQFRTLGRTGIKVSPYRLGAMMFGGIGNPDHEDCIRIIHKALDAGINFIDTRGPLQRGRVGGDRGQGAEGPTRQHRAGHQVPWADGRGSQHAGQLAAVDHPRGRGLCSAASAPTTSISIRFTGRSPDTDIEETLSAAHRPDAGRQGSRRSVPRPFRSPRSSRRNG